MIINLEILDYVYLFAEKEIKELNTKEYVPNMMLRRRLTRASKLAIELMNKINYKSGRIIYGSAFGELLATANILNAIQNNDVVSPTDFQNSVYNTSVSYASILFNNDSEILTISSGDETSLKVLKVGAIKALDGDEIVLICTETLNIENIKEIKNCIRYLETAVALKVKITSKIANIHYDNFCTNDFPKSICHLISIAKKCSNNNENIIKIVI